MPAIQLIGRAGGVASGGVAPGVPETVPLTVGKGGTAIVGVVETGGYEPTTGVRSYVVFVGAVTIGVLPAFVATVVAVATASPA